MESAVGAFHFDKQPENLCTQGYVILCMMLYLKVVWDAMPSAIALMIVHCYRLLSTFARKSSALLFARVSSAEDDLHSSLIAS